MSGYDGGRLGHKTDAEKRLISKLRKDAKTTVAEINNMKYDKPRKDKITPHIKNELKKVTIICGAVSSANGKICSNPPVEGAARCAAHGGYSTGPVSEEGKKNALSNLHPQAALVHGLNSRFVMTVEEEALYTGLMNIGIEKYNLDEFNTIILHRGLMNLILNERKEIAKAGEIIDESNSYNDYDSKFLKYMQALGLDRKFNESTNNKNNDKGVNFNVLFDGMS
ncbi:HGGxSTG domain-containing protein [Bacillus albus]|uniref:HGGxSTG domain-containing protein n=1 Tax=Bacillus albus TaxID=2026189 RepID=UPI0010202A42|nr:HGGxSTG domain-containing protein [Bacillus albus]